MVRRALRDGVGEGLRYAAEGVDVQRAVVFVHVVQPAGERNAVLHAQLAREGLQHRALRALAGDDELQPGDGLFCQRKAAHERGEVLHRVEPRGGADDHVPGANIGAHARVERRAVGLRYAAREVEAVIDGKGGGAREAAADEQRAHGVRHADVVLDVPQGEDVELAVGEGGGGAAQVVEPVVAVYGADHGLPGAHAQQRAGQVGARAVAVDDVAALRGDERAHFAQGVEEAAGENARVDAQRGGLLGEGPAAEADERHRHAAGEILQQRVDVGLGPAGVPAADEMYHFQGANLRLSICEIYSKMTLRAYYNPRRSRRSIRGRGAQNTEA